MRGKINIDALLPMSTKKIIQNGKVYPKHEYLPKLVFSQASYIDYGDLKNQYKWFWNSEAMFMNQEEEDVIGRLQLKELESQLQ